MVGSNTFLRSSPTITDRNVSTGSGRSVPLPIAAGARSAARRAWPRRLFLPASFEGPARRERFNRRSRTTPCRSSKWCCVCASPGIMPRSRDARGHSRKFARHCGVPRGPSGTRRGGSIRAVCRNSPAPTWRHAGRGFLLSRQTAAISRGLKRLGGDGLCRRVRKPNMHRCATSKLTLKQDRSAMLLDDLFHRRQPEPRAETFGAESVSYTHLTLPTICSV